MKIHPMFELKRTKNQVAKDIGKNQPKEYMEQTIKKFKEAKEVPANKTRQYKKYLQRLIEKEDEKVTNVALFNNKGRNKERIGEYDPEEDEFTWFIDKF